MPDVLALYPFSYSANALVGFEPTTSRLKVEVPDFCTSARWLQEPGSNRRVSAYETDELPTAPSRNVFEKLG